MSCELEFPSLFRREGRRLTTQRVAIATALRHAGGHRTAEELYQEVSATGDKRSRISLSTVYRTLEALEGMRLVSKLVAGNSATYEWIGEGDHHHHLICNDCGQVLPIELDSVAALVREIREREGFEPVIRHMGISGRCADCVARNRSGEPEVAASGHTRIQPGRP